RAAARGVRVVSGPAPLRQRPARGLRHGHRALRRVDVRHRAHPRDHPVPAYALQAETLSMEKIVTIFGGSKCGEESEEEGQALRLGQLLAESGYTICTGGYLGVMEGASKGAREHGGRVLGIVMNQFKSE